MGEDVVLYDFCDTLVDFQTANAYVEYVIRQSGKKKSIIDYVRILLNSSHLMPIINRFYKKISCNKAMLLYGLRGYTFEELDRLANQFYKEQVKPNLIKSTIPLLKNDINKDKTVVIISGGYDIYIKYFAQEFGIHHIISTKLKFKDGIFTGSILGNDCMGTEKVKQLNDFLVDSGLESNKPVLTLYSDSASDIPLFLHCEKRIAVVKDSLVPEWVKKIGAEVIRP